jgi:hypothetical protein
MTKKKLGGTIVEAFLVWLLECFQVVPDRRHPSLLFARMEAAPLFPREPSPDPDASFTRRMVLGWFACESRPVHARERSSKGADRVCPLGEGPPFAALTHRPVAAARV